MVTTSQQLQETAKTVLPDARVIISGTSGEDYPVKKVVAEGDALRIIVEDELPEPDDDSEEDGE